jgi:hypothetical protein
MIPKPSRRAPRRRTSEQPQPQQPEVLDALDDLAKIFWQAAIDELEAEMGREELVRSGQKPSK